MVNATRAHGENDIYVALACSRLGQHLLARGESTLAETYFKRALDVRRAIHQPGDWRIDEARGMLGVARMRAGRLGDAEIDLLASYEGLTDHRGPAAAESLAARHRLFELYQRWHRPEDARRYRDDPR